MDTIHSPLHPTNSPLDHAGMRSAPFRNLVRYGFLSPGYAKIAAVRSH